MRLEIDSVKFRNFFSFGNKMQEFSPSSGLNIILGRIPNTERSNGAGKSGLSETIPFALFGKTQKNVNLDQIINWKNNKNCEVIIKFTIGNDEFEVLRALKPHTLKIFKNGIAEDIEVDKRDYQRWFEDEILHIDFKTFMNLIYLNLNKSNSILAMKKWEKRDFFERLFNIHLYKIIYDKCNEKYKISNEKINILKTEKDTNNKILQFHLNEIERLTEKIQNVTSSKEHVKSTKDKFIKLKRKFNTISKNKEDINIEEIDVKIKILQHNNEKLENEIENIRKFRHELEIKNSKIIALKNNALERLEITKGKDICPTCWSEINSNDISTGILSDNKQRNIEIENLKLRIEKYSIEINKKRTEQKENSVRIQELNDKKDNQHEIDKTLSKLDKEISNIKTEYIYLQEKLEDEDKLRAEIEENIRKQNKKINEFKLKNEEIHKKIKGITSLNDYIDFIKNICKDDGVRQYALSSIRPYIEQQSNKYLSDIGYPFYIEFDKWLDAKIKGPGFSNKVYDSLSDGEKKSLDLSCQNAFIDIARIQSSIFPDVLIYDELLDTSLDSISLDNLLHIVKLKQLEDNSKILVISHRKEITEIDFDHTYIVEKRGGFSYLLKD